MGSLLFTLKVTFVFWMAKKQQVNVVGTVNYSYIEETYM